MACLDAERIGVMEISRMPNGICSLFIVSLALFFGFF